jgi:hypothetical protein
LVIQRLYAAPRITAVAARKAYQKLTLMVPRITMNSPMKPLVPGSPELAMAKSTKKAANTGMRLATPP